jgi:hypothetical protein
VKGLHRIILLAAIQLPRVKPYLLIASTAYCEHVGWKRQTLGKTFDTVFWYNLMKPRANWRIRYSLTISLDPEAWLLPFPSDGSQH